MTSGSRLAWPEIGIEEIRNRSSNMEGKMPQGISEGIKEVSKVSKRISPRSFSKFGFRPPGRAKSSNPNRKKAGKDLRVGGGVSFVPGRPVQSWGDPKLGRRIRPGRRIRRRRPRRVPFVDWSRPVAAPCSCAISSARRSHPRGWIRIEHPAINISSSLISSVPPFRRSATPPFRNGQISSASHGWNWTTKLEAAGVWNCNIGSVSQRFWQHSAIPECRKVAEKLSNPMD